MIRLLLKKQMLEIFKSYFYDAKKNKRRSTVSTVAFFVLFALLMVGMLGGMFGGLAYLLCEPFYVAGFGWFYYAIMGIIGIALGTFGSVFNNFLFPSVSHLIFTAFIIILSSGKILFYISYIHITKQIFK